MAALSVYLDASVVVPLFLLDPFVTQARNFLISSSGPFVVSDFVSAEFASVIGIRVRMKTLEMAEARAAFSNFDVWTKANAICVETSPADVQSAIAFLRRLDSTLRTPDAVNIAIARRLDAELATFDKRMAAAAKNLGVSVAKM